MIKKFLIVVGVSLSIAGANLHAMPDFKNYKNVQQKKVEFFNYLTPYVNQVNKDIYKDRKFILVFLQKFTSQSDIKVSEKNQIILLFEKYDIETDKINTATLTLLLSKADIIPVSLVLAQAANESAWGTSRFAIRGNNLFGQWCYKEGCGIVPKNRTPGKIHEVRKFNSVNESIRSYMMNLNSHYAYSKFREIRASLRAENRHLTGKKLAQGLGSYSERGAAYIKDIISMITRNGLEQFNSTFT